MQEQEEKHVYSDKWPKRWKESLDKWQKVKELHQNNISNIKIKIKIGGSCGYCKEFGAISLSSIPCLKCSLFQKKICICLRGDAITSGRFAYWELFNELTKKDHSKEIISSCIDKIITAIEEDDPSKVTASA
ncbi:TPA: hypothetical protein DCZ46_03140 [Candidatus Campbellbacteria bacterium]|nr:MAG: seg [Candidatus Campbellbacteria bacterium GW2011_OD1_34_28]KKP74875.1 MAG: hypothetical protein UR74_C0002G0141 [Candidatus Campbellbacteria bacterium GW2011_GWD2_35_24]KKP75761.1 MAG: hypothetical protein UR75_C0002G0142 [Candidatus Campbellbacteria bacterium GW2011_GWC2_35_28]KKP76991.1 MAG: hypothetical protein UR76_C0002G0192 [Candidatus Campbellbacteria bacterium GW2011_GWC1_35_31]KKP78917.1 MAG: hypothetical protein UR79_C0002G0192 [Candidatus Campbellbacteria bacterium GW2011_GW